MNNESNSLLNTSTHSENACPTDMLVLVLGSTHSDTELVWGLLVEIS